MSNLSEFPIDDDPDRPAPDADDGGPSTSVLGDDDVITRGRNAANGAKFAALFDRGDISGYKSQSEADLALCCMLAFWCRKDSGQIDRLFRRSALFREDKWNRRDDYRKRTIQEARDRTTEIYTPQPPKPNGHGRNGGGADQADPAGSLRAVSVASVVTEPVAWLWHPRIALGKLTMLEGDPGVGKSFLTAALATAVSRGYGLPDCDPREPGNVLMLSAEDGLADTIKPRLEQTGANTARVFVIDKAIALDYTGCADLHRVIGEHHPLLVTIDPIFAFVGAKTNIDRANEARAITARLGKIAEHHRCAMVPVRHLTKGGRDKSIYRGGGSIDWTAACRSVLLAGVDPTNGRRRALVQIKNNLAPFAEPVGFSIEDGVFAWTGKTNLSAAEMLANEEQSAEAATALAEAVDFLNEMLSSGPVLQEIIMNESQQAGISERTLLRAKQRLGIKSRKRIGDGKWEWFKPQAL